MNSEQKTHRLPCRGCMPNCKNYTICNGYPWRIDTSKSIGTKAHVLPSK